MKHAFFKPWVGKDYKNGLINGKKVFILGASFYCKKEECKYYEDCAINQNCIKYNKLCPHNNGRLLSNSAEGEIDEDGAISYTRFFIFMRWVRSLCATENFDDFWDKVAFTNYVQHFIGVRKNTLPSDLREDYLEMFVSVLDDFEKNKELPDVVIVWGHVIDKPLKYPYQGIPGHPECCIEIDEEKEGCVFYWKDFNGKDIIFINTFHPSYPKFYTDAEWNKMYLVFKSIFNLD